MKRWLLALCSLFSGAVFWVVWPVPVKPAFPLSVAFSCDIRGRLVPCGCFTGQLGGLTRIGSVLDGEVREDALKLDVGDALAGSEDYQRIEHRYVLAALAKLGYAAVNLGHREAALSLTQLQEMKALSPVPLLSANLLVKATGTPLFETHRIVRRGAWRIAVVGVMDSRLSPEALGEGLVIEPMQSALARLLPRLKKEADFVVLLAFTDETALEVLAGEFYELDLILGGKVAQPAQHLIRENRSWIFYTTNQARALGLMEVTLHAPSKMSVQNAEVLLMHERIAQAEDIQALAAAYRDEVRRTRLNVDDPVQPNRVAGLKHGATFVGSGSCLDCHANAARSWAGSGHARAFRPLVERGADADPSCLSCHTVGFGSESGYRRADAGAKLMDAGAKLTNVGCESCHGPGSLHVAQRVAGVAAPVKFRTLGAGDCQSCHFGEFSRPFSWELFWPKVAHGK